MEWKQGGFDLTDRGDRVKGEGMLAHEKGMIGRFI